MAPEFKGIADLLSDVSSSGISLDHTYLSDISDSWKITTLNYLRKFFHDRQLLSVSKYSFTDSDRMDILCRDFPIGRGIHKQYAACMDGEDAFLVSYFNFQLLSPLLLNSKRTLDKLALGFSSISLSPTSPLAYSSPKGVVGINGTVLPVRLNVPSGITSSNDFQQFIYDRLNLLLTKD